MVYDILGAAFDPKSPVAPNSTVTFTMTAENITNSVNTDCTLFIKRQDTGDVIGSKTEPVGPGEFISITVQDDVTMVMPSHDVTIEFETYYWASGEPVHDDEVQKTIKAPEPDIDVNQIDVPGTVQPDTVVEGAVELINTGAIEGTETFDVVMDGFTVDSVTATVPSGGTATDTFSFQAPSPGNHSVSIGAKTVNFTVEEGPQPNLSIRSTQFEATSCQISQGTLIRIVATVENTGDANGSGNIAFAAKNTAGSTGYTQQKSVSVGAGGTKQVATDSFTLDPGDWTPDAEVT